METQGVNLFSLLPELSSAATGNIILPGVSDSVSPKPDFNFAKIFSQLTTQPQDESLISIGGDISPPVIFRDIIRQPLTELPDHLAPVNVSNSHIEPSLFPVKKLSPEVPLSEPVSETIQVRERAFAPYQIQANSESQSSGIKHNLNSLSVSEIKTNEITTKKSDLQASAQNKVVQGITSEPNILSDNLQTSKVNQTVVPAAEATTDKPVVQSHTAALSLTAEITQLTKVPERKVTHGIIQPVTKQSVSTPEVPLNRLGQTLIQMINKGEQKLEFRLDPPELGKLTMTVAMERDSVSVQVITGSQTVRDLLLLQVDRLRNALADESITLGQMSVDVGRQSPEDQRSATSSETLWMADSGSELGEFHAASVMFKAQGGRLLDHFV